MSPSASATEQTLCLIGCNSCVQTMWWLTWGVSRRSASGCRCVSDWCLVYQRANCFQRSSLSTGSLGTHVWSSGASSLLYTHKHQHRIIIFSLTATFESGEKQTVQYPNSPAGRRGWRAGVHGRASPAAGTGWPTGLVSSQVKDIAHNNMDEGQFTHANVYTPLEALS